MIQEGSFVWLTEPRHGKKVVGCVLHVGEHVDEVHVRFPTMSGHEDLGCRKEKLVEAVPPAS